MNRFQRGCYVMFRTSHSGVRYFTGSFSDLGPNETGDVERAKPFVSAAHAYCYGGEHRQLQEWRVGGRDVQR